MNWPPPRSGPVRRTRRIASSRSWTAGSFRGLRTRWSRPTKRSPITFFWGDFCDWYIEWTKPRLADADRGLAVAAWRNLFSVFEAALRLLHPIMPFLTEELWHQLPQRTGAKSIALEKFPEVHGAWRDVRAESDFSLLQEIVVAARNIRAEMKFDPKRKVAAEFSSIDAAVRALVEENREAILRLAALSGLGISPHHLPAQGGAIRSSAQFDLRIAYAAAIDLASELARVRKEKERLARDIESKEKRLGDELFRSRAPKDIVRGLETTLAERRVEYEKLSERLAQLERGLEAAP
jgi:valyl-tRNA synthetase